MSKFEKWRLFPSKDFLNVHTYAATWIPKASSSAEGQPSGSQHGGGRGEGEGWVEGRGEGEGLQVNKFEQVRGVLSKMPVHTNLSNML